MAAELAKYLTSSIILVLLDSVYLKLISGRFTEQIKKVQGTKLELDLYSTVLCYLFLVFGLNYFIIRKNKSPTDAFLLGFVIYGVYELTSKALLTKWSWSTVVIDTVWGGVLFALTTMLTYYVLKNFIKK
jgi:uncharacterized membrane protein